jgi:serine/threonine protein kinase
MLALKEIHDGGFIHRDISPDNIMISDLNNRVYLIDFGTARANTAEEDKTISVFKKSGYTPPEQLRTKGKQGPWTDIYALCGTIYRCITGIKPLDVTDRLFGEELVRPSEYGIQISPQIEDAIMKGLEIHNEDRFQNIDALYDAIYKSEAWLNASDEEYTKVVEAVRNYKIHGNPRPKIEEVYRKKAEKEAKVPLNRPVYENEHDEVVRIVNEYKESPEYIAAYERFVKEDPEYLRKLEYEKIKEIVQEFKSNRKQELDAEAKMYIADVVKREMEQQES